MGYCNIYWRYIINIIFDITKMKVCLIYPQTLNHPDHPLGLMYIAAMLEKHGDEVLMLDPRKDYNKEDFIKKIKEFNPTFIGFTCTTIQTNLAYELAELIKKEMPLVRVVFGGVHPTAMPDEVISKPFVDYVIIGEGEQTFFELCHKDSTDIDGLVWKDEGKVCYNKPRQLTENLDELPFPARHLLPSKWYFASKIRGVWTKMAANIMASRGCPYKCIYCSSHLVFGYKVRYRSTDNVIQELEQIRKDFGVDSVWFADDTFTVRKDWVKELCNKLIAKNWKDFLWCCQLRVDTIDEETLSIMKKAGCIQVDIGVESGSQKVLNILKKGIKIEQIKAAFKLCKKVGVQSFASIIIGTPGETLEDIKLTEQLVKEIKADYTEFFFATPYPGTELYKIAIEKNLINKDNYEEWIASKQTDSPTMKSTEIPTEELVKIRSRLHNKVILRNYMTMFKRPSFVIGALGMVLKGFRGLPTGFKRFLKTGKIDNILLGMLDDYRRRTQ